MLRVKDCPFCESHGAVGIWRCTDKRTLILQCDECNALWLDPLRIDQTSAQTVTPTDPMLPGVLTLIYGPGAGWASKKEVGERGWTKYVTSEGKALGEIDG